MINQVIQRSKNELARSISPFSRKNSRSTHDEYAKYNAFHNVSKYDLDRGHVNMRDIWRENDRRKVENARNKRE